MYFIYVYVEKTTCGSHCMFSISCTFGMKLRELSAQSYIIIARYYTDHPIDIVIWYIYVYIDYMYSVYCM